MGKTGTGENQHNTVFIALTIGKEMEFVPILSYVHVKLWLLNSTKKISTINKIKLFLNKINNSIDVIFFKLHTKFGLNFYLYQISFEPKGIWVARDRVVWEGFVK